MKENEAYEDNLGAPNFPDFRSENPFTLPEHYFRDAAEHITNACRLADRLASLSPIDSEATPDYLEELTTKIKSRIFLEQHFPKDQLHGFSVPDDYFQSGAERILENSRLDTLRSNVAPEGGFAIPSGYFDQLSDRIAGRLYAHSEETQSTPESIQEKKVVPIRRRWVPYAAAACLLFVLSVSAYLGLNNDDAINPVAQQAVAEPSLDGISDGELIAYLALNDDHHDEADFVKYLCEDEDHEVEKVCSKLKDQELEAYIKEM